MASSGPGRYMIAQQRDPSCFLMPFYQLRVLEEIKTQEGGLRHFGDHWHTKFEWFVRTFPGIRDWQIAMGQLIAEGGAFAHWQDDMLSNGLLQEDIEHLHTEEGTPYINEADQDALFKTYCTPFTTYSRKYSSLTSSGYSDPIYLETQSDQEARSNTTPFWRLKGQP